MESRLSTSGYERTESSVSVEFLERYARDELGVTTLKIVGLSVQAVV